MNLENADDGITWRIQAMGTRVLDAQRDGYYFYNQPVSELLGGGRALSFRFPGVPAAVAPSTYNAAKARPPSARARRDAVVGPRLVELWERNYRVYGAH